MNKYLVRHKVISLGINRTAYQGDELSPEDLADIDEHRLIGLGAISPIGATGAARELPEQLEEDEKVKTAGKEEVIDFAAMITKADLAAFATERGLDLNPKSMNRDKMIEAIRQHLKK